MERRDLEKYAGIAGIVAVVLLVVAAVLTLGEPMPDKSASTILKWYHDNPNLLRTAVMLNTLAAVPFLVFLGLVRRRWQDPEDIGAWGSTMSAGGIALITTITIGLLPSVALVIAAQRASVAVGAGITHLLADFTFYVHGFEGVFSAVFIGALGLMILRGAFAKPWVAYLALLCAALGLIGGAASFFQGTNGAPNPISVLGLIGFFLSMVTLVVVSVFLVSRATDLANV